MSSIYFGKPSDTSSFDSTRYQYNADGTFSNKDIAIRLIVPDGTIVTAPDYEIEDGGTTDGGANHVYIWNTQYAADLQSFRDEVTLSNTGYAFRTWAPSMTSKVPATENDFLEYSACFTAMETAVFSVSPEYVAQRLDSEENIIEDTTTFKYLHISGEAESGNVNVTVTAYDANGSVVEDVIEEYSSSCIYTHTKSVDHILFADSITGQSLTCYVHSLKYGIGVSNYETYFIANTSNTAPSEDNTDWNETASPTVTNPYLWRKDVVTYGASDKTETAIFLASHLHADITFNLNTISYTIDNTAMTTAAMSKMLSIASCDSTSITTVTITNKNSTVSYEDSQFTFTTTASTSSTASADINDTTASLKLYFPEDYTPVDIYITVTMADGRVFTHVIAAVKTEYIKLVKYGYGTKSGKVDGSTYGELSDALGGIDSTNQYLWIQTLYSSGTTSEYCVDAFINEIGNIQYAYGTESTEVGSYGNYSAANDGINSTNQYLWVKITYTNGGYTRFIIKAWHDYISGVQYAKGSLTDPDSTSWSNTYPETDKDSRYVWTRFSYASGSTYTNPFPTLAWLNAISKVQYAYGTENTAVSAYSDSYVATTSDYKYEWVQFVYTDGSVSSAFSVLAWGKYPSSVQYAYGTESTAVGAYSTSYPTTDKDYRYVWTQFVYTDETTSTAFPTLAWTNYVSGVEYCISGSIEPDSGSSWNTAVSTDNINSDNPYVWTRICYADGSYSKAYPTLAWNQQITSIGYAAGTADGPSGSYQSSITSTSVSSSYPYIWIQFYFKDGSTSAYPVLAWVNSITGVGLEATSTINTDLLVTPNTSNPYFKLSINQTGGNSYYYWRGLPYDFVYKGSYYEGDEPGASAYECDMYYDADNYKLIFSDGGKTEWSDDNAIDLGAIVKSTAETLANNIIADTKPSVTFSTDGSDNTNTYVATFHNCTISGVLSGVGTGASSYNYSTEDGDKTAIWLVTPEFPAIWGDTYSLTVYYTYNDD